MTTVPQQTMTRPSGRKPWAALWALVIGFFMIMVDATIVGVAVPTISRELHADINAVIWVTSAYLFAYAVPLLVAGRLGDRFGPKTIYLIGLAMFTLASLWCGLAGSIEMLIVARVVQGLGAALMTPQTMAVITRLFPADKRGAAMGLWGSVAGVATLVGPVVGGQLVDGLGWQWIFFVNVPVGAVAFVLAARFVPRFEHRPLSFDWIGVVLSALGLFLVVFGIQEGESYDWGTITGPVSVWGLIISGLIVLIAFVIWQALGKRDPLLPLGLFRDRNFSLANVAIAAVGLAMSSFALPIILWAQDVKGFPPTVSSLLLIPMAVTSMGVAPVIGRRVDRWNPRWVAAIGLGCFSAGLFGTSAIIQVNGPWWGVIAPAVILGIGTGTMMSPLSVTATRNLPISLSGAGAGFFNTTRQVGAVLGSAGIAAIMQARLTSNLPAQDGHGSGGVSGLGSLPHALRDPFSLAMGQSLLLPAAVIVIAVIAALLFAKPKPVLHAVPRADVPLTTTTAN